MERMTTEERKAFIEQRVGQILNAFDEFSRFVSSMSVSERHTYVHRRVEADLVTFDQVNHQVDKQVTARQAEFKWLTLVDLVIFSALLLVSYEDPAHRGPLALVAMGFAASRWENFRLLLKARKILDMLHRMYSRLANTASLEFMVDEMSEFFQEPTPPEARVSVIETSDDYAAALKEIAHLQSMGLQPDTPDWARLKELVALVATYRIDSIAGETSLE